MRAHSSSSRRNEPAEPRWPAPQVDDVFSAARSSSRCRGAPDTPSRNDSMICSAIDARSIGTRPTAPHRSRAPAVTVRDTLPDIRAILDIREHGADHLDDVVSSPSACSSACRWARTPNGASHSLNPPAAAAEASQRSMPTCAPSRSQISSSSTGRPAGAQSTQTLPRLADAGGRRTSAKQRIHDALRQRALTGMSQVVRRDVVEAIRNTGAANAGSIAGSIAFALRHRHATHTPRPQVLRSGQDCAKQHGRGGHPVIRHARASRRASVQDRDLDEVDASARGRRALAPRSRRSSRIGQQNPARAAIEAVGRPRPRRRRHMSNRVRVVVAEQTDRQLDAGATASGATLLELEPIEVHRVRGSGIRLSADGRKIGVAHHLDWNRHPANALRSSCTGWTSIGTDWPRTVSTSVRAAGDRPGPSGSQARETPTCLGRTP